MHKQSKTESSGYYARFSIGIETSLMAIILIAVIASIYAAAYIFPIIGAFLLLMAITVMLSGAVVTGIAGVLLSLTFIVLGASSYYEHFLKWHSTLPLLTELPRFSYNKLKWVYVQLERNLSQ